MFKKQENLGKQQLVSKTRWYRFNTGKACGFRPRRVRFTPIPLNPHIPQPQYPSLFKTELYRLVVATTTTGDGLVSVPPSFPSASSSPVKTTFSAVKSFVLLERKRPATFAPVALRRSPPILSFFLFTSHSRARERIVVGKF